MFTPTHIVRTGTKRIPVRADTNATCGRGAALYTEAEWDSYDNADWELSDTGELLFKGEPARRVGAELHLLDALVIDAESGAYLDGGATQELAQAASTAPSVLACRDDADRVWRLLDETEIRKRPNGSRRVRVQVTS